MPQKGILFPGGQGQVIAVPDPIADLHVCGDSRLADPGLAQAGGNSTMDQGVSHKIDGFLNPARYSNVALVGSRLSWQNLGNCAPGDGGWGELITQFPRDDLIYLRAGTTITAAMTAGTSTSVAVTERSGFAAGVWVILGAGATIELIRVSTSYVAATGAGTVTFQTACTQNHVSGDPIYSAVSGEGWLPRSACVLMGWGGNDLAQSGPRNTVKLDGLVFGTNVGATRGWDPFIMTLRAVIAHMRCVLVYRDTHPSNVYGGTWTSNSAASTASYPTVVGYGGTPLVAATVNNQNYHSTTVNTATVTITCPPDMPAGSTVDMFFLAGTGGQGALWNFTVNASATLRDGTSGTGALDTRDANAVQENEAVGLPSGKISMACFRFKNMQPGDIIVATPATIKTAAAYLGWGIEAPKPPWIGVTLQARMYDYSGWGTSSFGYGYRAMAGARTATVTAGQGTAGTGNVTLGSAITTATAGTVSGTATQPGDTITIGTNPATMETRRITAIVDTTHVQVDAVFSNAHTGETVFIGIQDADFVGGGYVNKSDAQGAVSVPGQRNLKLALCKEFDAMVEPLDEDAILNGFAPPAAAPYTNYGPDGVHFNDAASSVVATGYAQRISRSRMNLLELAQATISNRRSWIPVYGDSGVSPAPGNPVLKYANSWSNYYPQAASSQLYPKSAVYKDPRTREVFVKGAIYGGNDGGNIWTMPASLLPEPGGGLALIPGWGSAGPGALYVDSAGNVRFFSGFPLNRDGTTGFFLFAGSYMAAGL